jgi:putative peptide zinc metalloprotease protein
MTLALRPTFSESWYRVVDLKPRLRPTAQISRVYYRGDRWYVVRDPAGNQFHRLSDAAYRFVGLLDGHRTVGEAWELVGGQLADDAPTQPEVIQILSQLYAANLIETNVTPDAQVLLRRHKKQQQQKMKQRFMNVLFPRIPIWDPDAFLKRWMPAVRPLLSRWGAVLWLVVVGLAIAMIVPEWQRLKTGALNALAPYNWPFLWATFIGLKFIHELGHAFACRRFGGECHEMGIMLLVLIPTPYVDASSAWSFPSKWARIFVGAGGMIVELFVAAIFAFVWLYTAPDTLLNQLSYNAMLIASFSTVIFNANPLLRYDGYYILSDWLEIPNLQHKSREYTLGLVKRHVFRVKSQQPLPPPGQRVWLVNYNILSSIYRIFVGFAIMLMVLYSLPEPAKVVGIFMFAGAFITFFCVPIFKLLKYLLVEPELHRKRARAWGFTAGVTAALVVLIGMVPFPVRVRAEGPVLPVQRAHLYVQSPGFVTDIWARDGQVVQQGDAILQLSDEQLLREIRQLEAKIRQLEHQSAKAAIEDQALRAIVEDELATRRAELAELRRRHDELTIRAPIAGKLVAPDLRSLRGRFLERSEQALGMVAGGDQLILYATLEQRESALLAGVANPPAEVRLIGQSDRIIPAARTELDPAGRREVRDPMVTYAGGGALPADPSDPSGRKTLDQNFELRVTLPEPDGDFVPVPGQRAVVRVTLESKPLIWQWGRRLRQVIQNASQSSPSTTG